MMYKVEKSKGKFIKLFMLAEVEDTDGNMVIVRKLIKEQKKKEMLLGLDKEIGMYQDDIKKAEDGMKETEQIKLLINDLDA